MNQQPACLACIERGSSQAAVRILLNPVCRTWPQVSTAQTVQSHDVLCCLNSQCSWKACCTKRILQNELFQVNIAHLPREHCLGRNLTCLNTQSFSLYQSGVQSWSFFVLNRRQSWIVNKWFCRQCLYCTHFPAVPAPFSSAHNTARTNPSARIQPFAVTLPDREPVPPGRNKELQETIVTQNEIWSISSMINK
jgi:hypothetical protein